MKDVIFLFIYFLQETEIRFSIDVGKRQDAIRTTVVAMGSGQDTRYKIQETLFKVDYQIYNRITLAIGYFVDKH